MKKGLLRSLTVALTMGLLLSGLAGCANEPKESEVEEDPVVIKVVGGWEDCKAIDAVGRKFTEKYSNCTIEYEYLQDFETTLPKRMEGSNAIDLFFFNSIQADSEQLPYALELFSCEGLDLSSTYEGLINNFIYFGGEESSVKKIYSIPLGAEMRGLYVNKTLLDSLDIAIPTDQESLFAACAKLKENGYIPFHGNPGNFAQTLLYPWICNTIANADHYQEAYDRVNQRTDGLGEMFREPFEFLYSLIENGYYDYKKAQAELNLFTDISDKGYCRDFLNIRKDGDTWKKVDDIGQVAFLPSAMALKSEMDKIKDDYHSEIEYVFMPAPVGEDGGFVYMSPARGMAVNKNSPNLEWSIKFLNFLFMPENNILFAEEFNVIPNTKDAFEYISTLFDVSEDHISQLGQVTFDYAFYGIITDALVQVSKGNNPKYMQGYVSGDPSEELSLYPLEHYVSAFEKEIQGDAE